MLDNDFIRLGDCRQIHKCIDAEHFPGQCIEGIGYLLLHIRLQRIGGTECIAVFFKRTEQAVRKLVFGQIHNENRFL